jgi:hypothetical protein
MGENQNDKKNADGRTGSSADTPSQELKLLPKKHSTAANVGYFLFVIVMAVIVGSYIFSHRTPTPRDALYLPLWIGVLTGWTAKRNGRRGWLWFLIGFVGIGFSFVIIVNILQVYFSSLTQ